MSEIHKESHIFSYLYSCFSYYAIKVFYIYLFTVGLDPFPLVMGMFLLRGIPGSEIQNKIIFRQLILKQAVALN
jgi:hypothetical protein